MVVGPFQLLCGNMRAGARIRVRAVRGIKPKATLGLWQKKGCQNQGGAAKIHGLEELYLDLQLQGSDGKQELQLRLTESESLGLHLEQD